MIRMGHGYDVHAFESGQQLIIGGVSIPYHQQFKAHSDGDVLLHAICDALLGAAALGDIGQHFPDTDAQYAGIDSQTLLRQVYQLLTAHGCTLNNIDATVVAQAPKLMPHLMMMRKNIAQCCQLEIEQVNVKATTTEHLGFCGREEGIAAHAVCVIEQNRGIQR